MLQPVNIECSSGCMASACADFGNPECMVKSKEIFKSSIRVLDSFQKLTTGFL